MAENRERRQARRQGRGLLRAKEILDAAGALFAEVGYDKTTTNLIAARAQVSPGSLYQFFSSKEAIAQAYAADAVERLHKVYDTILAPSTIAVPFQAFQETFLDRLIEFNLQHPGYLALSVASTVSPQLAGALAESHRGVLTRLEKVFEMLLPRSSPEERHLAQLISYRIFMALLPLVLASRGQRQKAVVRELKAVSYRYMEPMVNPIHPRRGRKTSPTRAESRDA